jgi:hypothetical protein
MCILFVEKVHWIQKTKLFCIKCWRCPLRPNYRHLTMKVNRNGFCSARFLCHENGSTDEMKSICLAQENQETHHYTHSGKFSNNETAGSVGNEQSLHLWERHPCTLAVEDIGQNGASRLQRHVTYVSNCRVTAILCVHWSNWTVLNCKHQYIFRMGCVAFYHPVLKQYEQQKWPVYVYFS